MRPYHGAVDALQTAALKGACGHPLARARPIDLVLTRSRPGHGAGRYWSYTGLQNHRGATHSGFRATVTAYVKRPLTSRVGQRPRATAVHAQRCREGNVSGTGRYGKSAETALCAVPGVILCGG